LVWVGSLKFCPIKRAFSLKGKKGEESTWIGHLGTRTIYLVEMDEREKRQEGEEQKERTDDSVKRR
jgi:hypothetical protein